MSITQAMINTYGEDRLKECFNSVCSYNEAYAVFMAIMRRDATNMARNSYRGAMKNSLSGLLQRLGVSYNN